MPDEDFVIKVIGDFTEFDSQMQRRMAGSGDTTFGAEGPRTSIGASGGNGLGGVQARLADNIERLTQAITGSAGGIISGGGTGGGDIGGFFPRPLKEVNRRIDKYIAAFGSDSPPGEAMGVLRDQINSMGVSEALRSLGPAKGPGQPAIFQGANRRDLGAEGRAYLERFSDIQLMGERDYPRHDLAGRAFISSWADTHMPDAFSRNAPGDFQPRGSTLNKLEEARLLPGLGSTMALPGVTRITPEMTADFDERFGRSKWLVKTTGDDALAGRGIYFPEKIARMRKQYGTDPEIASDVNAEFMVQPRFSAVGVTPEQRARGVTITPFEGRVHVVTRGGKSEVVPYGTSIKQPGEPGIYGTPVLFPTAQSRAMEQAALEAISQFPESERQGQVYGADVIRTPGGYRVVEANPSDAGGGSGYLHDDPFTIDAYTSHLTGGEPAHVRFARNLLGRRMRQPARRGYSQLPSYGPYARLTSSGDSGGLASAENLGEMTTRGSDRGISRFTSVNRNYDFDAEYTVRSDSGGRRLITDQSEGGGGGGMGGGGGGGGGINGGSEWEGDRGEGWNEKGFPRGASERSDYFDHNAGKRKSMSYFSRFLAIESVRLGTDLAWAKRGDSMEQSLAMGDPSKQINADIQFQDKVASSLPLGMGRLAVLIKEAREGKQEEAIRYSQAQVEAGNTYAASRMEGIQLNRSLIREANRAELPLGSARAFADVQENVTQRIQAEQPAAARRADAEATRHRDALADIDRKYKDAGSAGMHQYRSDYTSEFLNTLSAEVKGSDPWRDNPNSAYMQERRGENATNQQNIRAINSENQSNQAAIRLTGHLQERDITRAVARATDVAVEIARNDRVASMAMFSPSSYFTREGRMQLEEQQDRIATGDFQSMQARERIDARDNPDLTKNLNETQPAAESRFNRIQEMRQAQRTEGFRRETNISLSQSHTSAAVSSALLDLKPYEAIGEKEWGSAVQIARSGKTEEEMKADNQAVINAAWVERMHFGQSQVQRRQGLRTTERQTDLMAGAFGANRYSNERQADVEGIIGEAQSSARAYHWMGDDTSAALATKIGGNQLRQRETALLNGLRATGPGEGGYFGAPLAGASDDITKSLKQYQAGEARLANDPLGGGSAGMGKDAIPGMFQALIDATLSIRDKIGSLVATD